MSRARVHAQSTSSVRRLEGAAKSPIFVKAELLQTDREISIDNNFNIIVKAPGDTVGVWVSNVLTGAEGKFISDPCCSSVPKEYPGLAVHIGNWENVDSYPGWWTECDIGKLSKGIVVIFEIAEEYLKATMINKKNLKTCEVDSRYDTAFDRRRLDGGIYGYFYYESRFLPFGDESVLDIQFGSAGVSKWSSIQVCKGVPSE